MLYIEPFHGLDEKHGLRTCTKQPKSEILRSISFDYMTSNDLNVTRGHGTLRRALRSVPDTIHVVLSALFQFYTVAFSAKPAKTDSKKI